MYAAIFGEENAGKSVGGDGFSADDLRNEMMLPQLQSEEALQKFLEQNPLTPEEKVEMDHVLEYNRIRLIFTFKNDNAVTTEEMKALADALDDLQKPENDGRGVSCVETAVTYLRAGFIDKARAVVWNEGDKLWAYPYIHRFLKLTLMKFEHWHDLFDPAE